MRAGITSVNGRARLTSRRPMTECDERIKRALAWASASDRVPFKALHSESQIRLHSESSAGRYFKSAVSDDSERPEPASL